MISKTLFLLFTILFINIETKTSVEDRAVKIKNITFNYQKVNAYKYGEDQSLFQDLESQGKIQFFPVSKYWKIEFNNNGLKLPSSNFESTKKLLEQIFEKEIGSFELNDKESTLKSIILKKPLEKQPNFEHSRLKNKCWRIDIYPFSQKQQVFLNFNFCVSSEKEDDTIQRYRHILEDKELGKKNHE